MSALGEAAKHTHTSTIGRLMYREGDTSAETIEKVVDALAQAGPWSRETVQRRVRALVGHDLENATPFAPHPDADLLTSDERAAVNELIRLMALPKKRGGGEREGSSAPIGDEGPPSLSVVQSEAARKSTRKKPPEA